MGKCHFLDEWLDREDNNGSKVSEWGRKDKDNTRAFCTVCECSFSIEKGFYALNKHAERDKHISNMEIKKKSCQLQISAGATNNITLYSPKDAAYAAELIWCMKTISSNMSLNSCQDISEVFKAMFRDGVPDGFSLNPTKAGYLITEALAPYFRNIFLKEAQGEYFTLQFDETTNNAGLKELQTSVRFWSPSKKEIISKHLETFYLGHATAEVVKEKIMLALDNANLSLSNLLMLGSDGPNVNKKVFRVVNEEVKLCREKGLVNIGFCNVHMVHNAFQKGLEELGCDISDFIVHIYHFFHDWPSRWEDFNNIQKKMKVPQLHFLKHVNSRWLTIESAAVRVIQQWDAIIEYFLNYVPMKISQLTRTSSFKRIVLLLKKKTLKAELHFVIESARLFTEFTGYFQKDEPLIHVLYENIKFLLEKLLVRICKEESVRCSTHFSEELLDSKHLLTPAKIIVSDDVLGLLSGVPESDKKHFLFSVQKHFISAAQYIMKKIELGNNLQCFRCLQPSKIKSKSSFQDICTVLQVLPLKIDSEKIKTEWKILSLSNNDNDETIRIDHYWSKIFDIKHFDTDKYPTLSKVVKACLSLSHGSANIERGFSRSGRILTEDKASMSIKMLNSKLAVSDGLRWFDNKPENVPITKDLLKLAYNARSSYAAFLEKERLKKEEETRMSEISKKEKELADMKLKEIESNTKGIEKLKEDLKVAKKDENTQLKVSNKLLEEANDRLKKALEKNDFVEAKVAQAMIESALKTKQQFQEKRKTVDELSKEIDKRKDSVIKRKDSFMTNFFNKKPKTN